MYINEKRSYDLLNEIAFVRTGGSNEELLALKILKEQLDSNNLKSNIEAFEVNNYEVKTAKLEVLEPFNKEYNVLGIGLTGNTPAKGLITDFEYVEKGEQINLTNAKGKVVLINGRITEATYKNLINAKVAGFISLSGTVIDEEDKTDIEKRELREKLLNQGKIPGISMRAKDAMDMVINGAKRVKMTLIQEEGKGKSHNLITEIKGTEFDNEVIMFMAHYDSVPYSKGVYDNGAGSVIIMELLHYYLKNVPKRTVKFIWFGSEERGLLGSKAYVEAHNEELENVKLAINVDMAGPILGEDRAFITADMSLCHAVDYLSKEIGFPISAEQSTYSSDCIPFADKGVPAISFARFGAPGCSPGHNRYDLIEHISSKSLCKTAGFIKIFSEKLINSFVFPVPSKMPDNMVEAINKYLKK